MTSSHFIPNPHGTTDGNPGETSGEALLSEVAVDQLPVDQMPVGQMAVASAPGKINLQLLVDGPDERGYHPLVSVFESVSMREYVQLELAAPGTLTVTTLCYRDGRYDSAATAEAAQIPPDRHLAVRAVKKLMPQGAGVTVTVHKTIPTAGGMAGGSADAAAALVAANELWSLGLTRRELEDIGRTLGADVPACIHGGLSLGTGYGDEMVSIRSDRRDLWMLAFATEGLSTPEVFAEFDRLNPSLNHGFRGVPTTGEELAAQKCRNDLAEAALNLRPELALVGEAALAAGASQWMISGSGPTVAAQVADTEVAMRVEKKWDSMNFIRDSTCVSGPVEGAKVELEVPHWAHK